MPLGDILAELGLRLLLELVLYGLTYWPGYLILKIVSLGQLELAPVSTFGDRNKGRVFDFSIWLYRDFAPSALRAEFVCLIGFLFWLLVATGVYFLYPHAPPVPPKP
jgi:hypothetical protein